MPVHRCVRDPGRVGGRRRRDDQFSTGTDGRDKGDDKRSHEKHDADEAELGKHLGVETVRVSNDARTRPILVPEILVGAGAVTEQGSFTTGVPGDADGFGSAVSGQLEQALGEVATLVGGRSFEPLLDLRERVTRTSREHQAGRKGRDGERDERRVESPRRPTGHAQTTAEPSSGDGDQGGGDRKPGNDQREAVALRDRVGARRVLGRERVIARSDRYRDGGCRGDDEQHAGRAQTVGVDRDEHGGADRQCCPRTTAEREVERRGEDRQRRRGDPDDVRTACVRHQAERDEDAHHSKEPEGVPVADRLGEPVRDDGVVVGLEAVRKEPRHERVARDRDRAGEDAPGKRRDVASSENERQRARERDVDEHPLCLAQRPGGRRRPRRRERNPDAEQRHETRERHAEHARRRREARDESKRHRGDGHERDPAPGLREIASLATVGGRHQGGDGQTHRPGASRASACRPVRSQRLPHAQISYVSRQ